jgi:hypothetical protein
MAPPPIDPTYLLALIAFTPDDQLLQFVFDLPQPLQQLLGQLVQSNDQLKARFQAVMLPEEDPDTGPQYRPGFSPTPRPSWGQIDTWASEAETRWADRASRVRRGMDVYFGREIGIFKADLETEWYKDRFYSSGLTDDTNMAISTIAEAKLRISMTPPHAGLRKETQVCEDWLRWDRKEDEYHHARGGHGSLPYDETKHMVLGGALCARVVLNPQDSKKPVRYDLVDPTTAYPEWGSPYGMTRLIRVEEVTVAQILQDYDEDGELADKLLDWRKERKTERGASYRASDEKSKTGPGKTMWEVETVVEYWDEWWRGVWTRDGFPIVKLVEHEYGFVPWVFQFSDLGRPRTLGAATRETVHTDDGETSIVRGNDEHVLRDTGLAFYDYRIEPHLQLEAYLNKHWKTFSRSDDPTWMAKQDLVGRKTRKSNEIATGPGDFNPMSMDHEDLDPWIPVIPPSLYQALEQHIGADKATGQQPLAAFGAPQSSQATGNALDGMVRAGQEKLAPFMNPIALFHAQVSEMKLCLIRDWGDVVEDEYGDLVEGFTVPTSPARRRTGTETHVTLTPEIVRKVGTRVECTLDNPSTRNLPMLVNAQAAAIQSGQMPRRIAIENLGNDDAYDIMAEIQEEEAMASPELKKYALAQGIADRYRDPVTGELSPEGWFWLNQLFMGQPQQGGDGGAPGAPPSPQGGGGPQMPNSSSGLAMNQFNPNAGAGAGRPPGIGGPQTPGGIPTQASPYPQGG